MVSFRAVGRQKRRRRRKKKGDKIETMIVRESLLQGAVKSPNDGC